jgi:hypothetical protein
MNDALSLKINALHKLVIGTEGRHLPIVVNHHYSIMCIIRF